MRLDRVALLVVVAGAALFGGCQSPDVGQRCELAWGPTNPPRPNEVSGDYLETGNLACDSLVCIVSPATSGQYASCSGAQCGYCSKPCVSDRDCYTSSTDLVCAQLILDPMFIASLDEATRQRYLGEIQFANYCVVRR